jgi:hypothetical protein
MVLPASDGVSRVPPYSGFTPERTKFRLQGSYLLWLAFPGQFTYSVPFLLHVECPTTPRGKPLGLGCFRFARRYSGNRLFLSLPLGTKMFQFPRSAFSYPMYSGKDTVPLRTVGFPIRKSPDQCLLTAPRGISVFVPSFFGS